MKIYQQVLTLSQRKRGFHIITSELVYVMPQINQIKVGICQVFIQHTSASLCINENAAVPEHDPDYRHDDEGPDDMPAHLKAAVLGASVTIPIRNGRLALGMWQGIYLCEHRDRGGERDLIVTVWGE
jgi:secondary thiamine-phosphate synthase enzyme